ncbi:hypothetical protein HYC85_026455 [Camellia sinensis]|uniref:Amino acid transporter transmembrane domain-containing protein n=1 Tax=Camellia sinensis TaxID=4442 RepID=A0A7J7G7N7_CAMSI|nr:hypothetical protein HYC85_026455 [Camellia sinensis]
MAEPPQIDRFPECSRDEDAGAAFVLESKGQWWHAGFHLTTAIVGPTILTLPYAFRGLGWGLGFLCLTVMGVVTFYSYYLMSLVLEHCEKDGRRHIRFRELAADVLGNQNPSLTRSFSIQFLSVFSTRSVLEKLSGRVETNIKHRKFMRYLGLPHGSGWMFYLVIFIQTAINTGIGIGAILLAGECLQVLDSDFSPSCLYKIMYSNLSPNGSLKLYEFIAMVTVVMIVLSQLPTFHSLRHINLVSLLLSLGYTLLVVGASIHAGTSKNAPPRDYSLEKSESLRIFSAFTSISIIAAIFGNGILPEIQVYSQVAFEIMEKKSADVKQGLFSKRNLVPRLILRTLYMIFCGFFAAMLPFFGDINGVVGAIGFIPLDFILPMLLYNMTFKPPRSSLTYWINVSIMVAFTGAGIMGSFSSIRKLVLDANKFKLFSSNVVD